MRRGGSVPAVVGVAVVVGGKELQEAEVATAATIEAVGKETVGVSILLPLESVTVVVVEPVTEPASATVVVVTLSVLMALATLSLETAVEPETAFDSSSGSGGSISPPLLDGSRKGGTGVKTDSRLMGLDRDASDARAKSSSATPASSILCSGTTSFATTST